MAECKNNSQFLRKWEYRASPRVCKSWPFYSFLGDYALQGDGHPEMQAIDRFKRNRVTEYSGDGHPEMQAIDRVFVVQPLAFTGDGHPEMQAIDRMTALQMISSSGDGHPEMQAIDRTKDP